MGDRAYSVSPNLVNALADEKVNVLARSARNVLVDTMMEIKVR